jgi:polar amino acid transport system substrate-binding protein
VQFVCRLRFPLNLASLLKIKCGMNLAAQFFPGGVSRALKALAYLARVAMFGMLACAGSAVGQTTTPPLRVVTEDVEPFSFGGPDGEKGFAIELWTEIARKLEVPFEVKVVGSPKEMIDALLAGEADVAVGALSMNAEREGRIDFTHPYYDSGLGIVVHAEGDSLISDLLSAAGEIFTWKLVGALVLLLGVLLLVSHLVWLFERRVDPEMWPPRPYLAGLWEAIWWSTTAMLVGGSEKSPTGLGGRIVAIFWMLVSILLLAVLTASFTATLTVNTLRSEITGPKDLPGKTVATLKESTAERWLAEHDANVRIFDDIDDCLSALEKREVAAVVFDLPVLQYHLKDRGDGPLRLVGETFDRQSYAFAVRENEPLRERINRELLRLEADGVLDRLNREWFGTE